MNVSIYQRQTYKTTALIFFVLYGFIDTAFGTTISKDLREYDFEEIVSAALFSKASYPDLDGSDAQRTLESQGWELTPIRREGGTELAGYRGEFGPLVVVGFTGTYYTDQYAADLDAVRLNSKIAGCADYVHRGIYNYSKKVPILKQLFDPDKGDELLILTGHSSGGAVAQLKGFEAFEQYNTEELNNFCSIVSVGAPPILGISLKSRLDQIFPAFSNIRFALSNDVVVNYTRGQPGTPHYFEDTREKETVFVHAGYPITLKSDETHSVNEYVDLIKTQKLEEWKDKKPSTLNGIESLTYSQSSKNYLLWKAFHKQAQNSKSMLEIWSKLFDQYVIKSKKISERFLRKTDGYLFCSEKDLHVAINMIKILALSSNMDIQLFSLRHLEMMWFSLSSDITRDHVLSLFSEIKDFYKSGSLLDLIKDLEEDFYETVVCNDKIDESTRKIFMDKLPLPKELTSTEYGLHHSDVWQLAKKASQGIKERKLRAYSQYAFSGPEYIGDSARRTRHKMLLEVSGTVQDNESVYSSLPFSLSANKIVNDRCVLLALNIDEQAVIKNKYDTYMTWLEFNKYRLSMNTAYNFLKMGLKAQAIADCLGLSLEAVENLQEAIQE